MSRVEEPVTIRARGSRPGEWRVWIRPSSGLPESICDEWTERSLRRAPPRFLGTIQWPKSKIAAEKVARALVDYLGNNLPVPPDPAGPTVSDYAGKFRSADKSPRAKKLAAAGRAYSPNTLENYRDKIDRYVLSDEKFAALKMGNVRRPDLEDYFARLHKKIGACRTMQDTWQIVHMIFEQYADDNGSISPFKGILKPTYSELVRGALTEAELMTIFSLPFPRQIDRAICALAFWAGLRRSEVFALTWEDVDLVQKRLVVSRAVKQFGREKESEGPTKSRKARIVPMVAEVEETLKALPRAGDRVILLPDGSDPGARAWRTAMEGAFRQAGIDAEGRKITPHSSRHSIASVLLSRGVPKEYIRLILGHFDERTTDGYLHMAVEEIDKMREKADGKRPINTIGAD